MLEHRLQQHFIDSADLNYQAAQALSGPVSHAVQSILACVTSGGKVLCCGDSAGSLAAQYFAMNCVGRFERDRPGLAAFALHCDRPTVTGAIREHDPQSGFARQVRALGQAGDVLLVVLADGKCSDVLQAVGAAHERDITVIALTGCGGGRLNELLPETDVHICVPSDRSARIHEIHLVVLNSLCDGVDTQLLGEQELTI